MERLTNKQKMDIIADMVIIVDSREQKWKHIKDFLDKKGIKYKVEKLDVGDYTFKLPNYPELNMDNKFIIERKASLDELAGNFTKGRDRFAREFERLKDEQKIHLLLENFTWRKCLNGSYRSGFTPEAYKASLIAWSIKYNFPVWTIVKQDSGEIIYEILKKELEFVLNNIK